MLGGNEEAGELRGVQGLYCTEGMCLAGGTREVARMASSAKGKALSPYSILLQWGRQTPFLGIKLSFYHSFHVP